MAWLGVNLNESINSIKGQITNFTRDVLADDEMADHNVEILIPKNRIKEYESSILLYQEEIKQLKSYRSEAEERIIALEYNHSKKYSSISQQLNETQKELEKLKDKSSEWRWDEGSEDSKNQLNHRSDDSVYVEKISFLQKQLVEEKRRREEEILAIQEQQRADVLQLRAARDAENGKPVGTPFSNVCLNDEYVENEKDKRIKEVEEELYMLRSDHSLLCEEKEQFATNMVDLDNQHQMIIDEVLKSKKELAEDLRKTKGELLSLMSFFPKPENVIGQLKEMKESLQSLSSENAFLQQRLNEMNKQSDEASDSQVEHLQRIVSSQEEQIQRLNTCLDEGKQRENQLSSEVHRLSSLSKELEITKDSVERLQGELAAVESNEEANETENNQLKSQIKGLEKHVHDANKLINGLNDKLLYKQEEILKLQAVLEEKNNEHMNAYRKLKEHEEMTLATIKEFQKDKLDLQKTIHELEAKNCAAEANSSSSQSDFESLLKKLIQKCNVQKYEDLPTVVSEFNSEIASLRCERDRLAEDYRDAQELLENLETEKTDLERECEDLRDQLEELQCGERVQPEGSLTPRSLPTIEEEEADITILSPADIAKELNVVELNTVEGSLEMQERVNELHSQVIALSEARQNLEMELSLVKREKIDLEQRLSEVNSQLGNLTNLEAEAASLRNENETLQYQLNDSNKHIDVFCQVEQEKYQLQQQYQHMVDSMDKMTMESSNTHQGELEEKINMQNKAIQEHISEISQLKRYINENNNSFASQEQISLLQSELDKAKGLVIYKDDQIDQFKQGIEQIRVLFKISNSDLRQTYLYVKQEYDSLMKKMYKTNKELEALKEEDKLLREENQNKIRNEYERIVMNLSTNLEAVNKQLLETQRELENTQHSKGTILKEYEEKLNTLSSQNINVMKENNELVNKIELVANENEILQNQLQASGTISDNFNSILHDNKILIKNLENKLVEKEEDFNTRIRSLEEELLSSQDVKPNVDFINSIENNFKQTIENLNKETESLKTQISDLNDERQQMIATSTKKHQESVTYYNEIQRLNDHIRKEEQRTTFEISSLSKKLMEVTEEKKLTIEEAAVLRQTIEFTRNDSVPKLEAKKLQDECLRKTEEFGKLNEELKKQQESNRNVIKERDHLRIANSSFNSQYEEKSKEVIALQEKEKHLTQEIQRLKQHLVEVEETYTNEAVKSEQRESSLKQSLAKAHEKMASHSNHYSSENQKTVAHMESMQEKFSEVIHQRDEAREQLQVLEESSLQHQEALTRLQQVLQDFQKNQAREISMATEREKRKWEKEKDKNTELGIHMMKVKEKLQEMESVSVTTETLRNELLTKEDTILALKSQVNAVNLAAKKSQEQVALLQSNSDAKVDKHLLRNLLVGYFATPSDKQREVLHIVAQVLDFSPEERARTSIDQQAGSWLSSIANFLAPPPSNIRVASKVDVLDHISLSQAFIRFLEEESLPKSHPKLPAVQMAEEAKQKAQKKNQSKNIAMGKNIDVVLSNSSVVITNPAQSASEATNSLLLSSNSNLQGNFPFISTPALSTNPVLNPEEVSTPKFLNNLLNPKDKNSENESDSTS